jgi:hypothetical protein
MPLTNLITSVQLTKNYLINGDMRISQRGLTFSAIASSAYSLDRWQYISTSTAVHTITQDSDTPSVAQANYLFQASLRANLTTPKTSVAAGDLIDIRQQIEGYNWANIAQKQFTFSFWVKATLPGIYCVAFRNGGADRSYVAEYTINGASTWEYKTITVSASPSAGTWNYTNGSGLLVVWTLAAGTTFQSVAGSWQTGQFYATANQVNGVNTGSTDFRVTGAMLNEGATAAPFQLFSLNSLQGELAACQRYYEAASVIETGTVPDGRHFYPGNTPTVTTVSASVFFLIQKRTSPSSITLDTTAANWRYYNNAGGASPSTVASATILDVNGFNLNFTIPTGSAGVSTSVFYANGGAVAWAANAEL